LSRHTDYVTEARLVSARVATYDSFVLPLHTALQLYFLSYHKLNWYE
jgi:hypothetical protein